MPRRVPDLSKLARPDRLRAEGAPGRDPRPGDRVLRVGQGAGVNRGPAAAPAQAGRPLGGLRRGRRLRQRRQLPAHPALHAVPRARRLRPPGAAAAVRHAGQDRLPPGPGRRVLPHPLRPGVDEADAAEPGGYGQPCSRRGWARRCSRPTALGAAPPRARLLRRRRRPRALGGAGRGGRGRGHARLRAARPAAHRGPARSASRRSRRCATRSTSVLKVVLLVARAGRRRRRYGATCVSTTAFVAALLPLLRGRARARFARRPAAGGAGLRPAQGAARAHGAGRRTWPTARSSTCS